jgi:hypothetical protein
MKLIQQFRARRTRGPSGRWLLLGATVAVAAALSLALVFGGTGSAAGAGVTQVPMIHPNGVYHGTSANWAGYAVETNLTTPVAKVVKDVKATWVVPTVTGTKSVPAYSSMWIGIDGYATSTVEQIGTEQDWNGTAGSYYAWYEMYPAASVQIGKVYAGDTITAEISCPSAGTYVFTFKDTTHALTFTKTLTSSTALYQSAEWIVEAPTSLSGVLPLANFKTATFSACSATLSSHAGGITDSAWKYDTITMSASGVTKATTGTYSTTTKGFTVTWKHA